MGIILKMAISIFEFPRFSTKAGGNSHLMCDCLIKAAAEVDSQSAGVSLHNTTVDVFSSLHTQATS